MSIEAMKQMVEALQKAKRQCHYHNVPPHGAYDDAIAVGLQAIVEAEKQEPVACLHRLVDVTNPVVKSGYMCMDCGAVFRAAFESQPKREPLTFYQVEDCFPELPSVFVDAYGDHQTSPRWLHDFARAIEAAHGIKETP